MKMMKQLTTLMVLIVLMLSCVSVVYGADGLEEVPSDWVLRQTHVYSSDGSFLGVYSASDSKGFSLDDSNGYHSVTIVFSPGSGAVQGMNPQGSQNVGGNLVSYYGNSQTVDGVQYYQTGPDTWSAADGSTRSDDYVKSKTPPQKAETPPVAAPGGVSKVQNDADNKAPEGTLKDPFGTSNIPKDRTSTIYVDIGDGKKPITLEPSETLTDFDSNTGYYRVENKNKQIIEERTDDGFVITSIGFESNEEDSVASTMTVKYPDGREIKFKGDIHDSLRSDSEHQDDRPNEDIAGILWTARALGIENAEDFNRLNRLESVQPGQARLNTREQFGDQWVYSQDSGSYVITNGNVWEDGGTGGSTKDPLVINPDGSSIQYGGNMAVEAGTRKINPPAEANTPYSATLRTPQGTTLGTVDVNDKGVATGTEFGYNTNGDINKVSVGPIGEPGVKPQDTSSFFDKTQPAKGKDPATKSGVNFNAGAGYSYEFGNDAGTQVISLGTVKLANDVEGTLYREYDTGEEYIRVDSVPGGADTSSDTSGVFTGHYQGDKISCAGKCDNIEGGTLTTPDADGETSKTNTDASEVQKGADDAQAGIDKQTGKYGGAGNAFMGNARWLNWLNKYTNNPFSGLSGFTSLFPEDSGYAQFAQGMRDTAQALFCDVIPTQIDCLVSQICETNWGVQSASFLGNTASLGAIPTFEGADLPDDTIYITDPNTGLITPVAHIEGDRSLPYTFQNASGLQTQYLYKISYKITNIRSNDADLSTVSSADESDLTYTITLMGPGVTHTPIDGFVLEYGETASASGSSMVLFYSKNYYETVKLHVSPGLPDWRGMNTFFGYHGEEDTITATITSSAGGGATAPITDGGTAGGTTDTTDTDGDGTPDVDAETPNWG